MQVSLILFDFDGTIADTFSETIRIFNLFANKYGFKQIKDKDVEKARHMNVWQLLRFAEVPKRKVPFLLRRGRKLLYRNLDKITVFPGMRDVLEYTQGAGVPCGIITSNSKKNVERFIQINNLPNIHFVKASSRIFGKPREFRKVMKKQRVAPANVVYVGDETRDIDASKECGVRVIAVAWGYNSTESLRNASPNFFADSPEQLMTIIQDLCPVKSHLEESVDSAAGAI